MSTSAAAWRAANPGVTGVCAFNDNTALAVLAGLRHLGLTAPSVLAVIGIDDTPAAELAAPPLTTVIIDMQAVAKHLARTIVSALAGKPAAPPTRIQHRPPRPPRLSVSPKPAGPAPLPAFVIADAVGTCRWRTGWRRPTRRRSRRR